MMYNSKFIVCVKNADKILREQDDSVFLPFGSEYKIYLKNLNSQKAKVNISIDNRDVVKGLLIEPNSFVELERFVEGFSMSSGPRFKFIEKTQEISDFRGDKPEDGLIRVEFWFEKQKSITQIIERKYIDSYPLYPFYKPYYNNFWYGTSIGSSTLHDNSISTTVASYSAHPIQDNCCLNTNDANEYAVNQFLSKGISQNVEGITVEGNDSSQKFEYGRIGELEENSHVIVLKLYGTTSDNIVVEKPITVETKIRCKQCGKTFPSSQKFCGGCGARLI